MERERSSKRTREDRERESGKEQRHRDRDGEHKSHRDRGDDERRRDSDQRRHHHRQHRSDHKTSRREDREGSRDREVKRDKSYDVGDDREWSRDKVGFTRERSHDSRNEWEGSKDKESKGEKSLHRDDDRSENLQKESKIVDKDDSRHRKKYREFRREGSFEDKEEDRGMRHKRKDRGEETERKEGEKRAKSENKREKSYEGRVGEESLESEGFKDGNLKARVGEVTVEQGADYNAGAVKGKVKTENAAGKVLNSLAPIYVPESSLALRLSHPLKVSSHLTTNENTGVSVTRSHEVPGKSSTDGTSPTPGKSSANLSLDALAKAKKALQMQKELSQKLKKMPLLNKNSSTASDKVNGTGVSAPASSTTIGSVSTIGISSPPLPAATMASVKPVAGGEHGLAGLGSISNMEAVKRAQELAAKMGFRQDPEFAPLINLFPGHMPPEVSGPQKPIKAPVLRVDAFGREIDEHGNIVNVAKPSNLSTLKVNINKQKKDAFQIVKPQLDIDPESNPHFDAGMGINKNKLLRPKRLTFQFVEEGKWSKEAEIIKLKSQWGDAKAKELKAKQAQLSKAKADINPNLIEISERVIMKEKRKDTIPDVEWWDKPLLVDSTYGDMMDTFIPDDRLKSEKINIYVEHPRPIEPPAEPAPPPPQPLKLTKMEQKKLRTQRRLAREKERQEMIRQGLIEPPKPKVKMSNLMKVLGSEATQDPTRLEKEIRTAAAEREQAHIDRNTARKLTPDERRLKKERKLFDDSRTVETIVSVYRITELSHPKARFKVDMNARENRLTGCAVITEGMSVVVVEGGNKSIKRYGKLMLKRINWFELGKEDEDDDDENGDKPINKCVLVWQGSVAKASFNRFNIHECITEAAARKVFNDAGVGHYWDLAVNFVED